MLAKQHIETNTFLKKGFGLTELLAIIKIVAKCDVSTNGMQNTSPLKPTYAAYEGNCKASAAQCS